MPENTAVRTLRFASVALATVGIALLGPGWVTLADGYAVTVDDDGSVAWVSSRGDEADAAYLGVQLEEETELPEGGARVTRVVDDSPADEAGLEEGDIVVGFDGQVIRGPVGLTKQIHAKQAGDRVTIRIVRRGEKLKLEAELADRSERWTVTEPYGLGWNYKIAVPELSDEIQEELKNKLKGLNSEDLRLKIEEGLGRVQVCPGGDCWIYGVGGWGGRARLGVQLVEATPELREHLGGSRDAGVLVSKVLGGTPADNAGVHVGDLIVSLGGDEISGVTDLRRALAQHQGETFDLEVVRDGSPMRLSVTLPAVEEDPPSGPRAGLAIKVPPVLLAPRAPRVQVTTPPPLRLQPPAPTRPRNEPPPLVPPARPARPARARGDQVV